MGNGINELSIAIAKRIPIYPSGLTISRVVVMKD